MSTLTNILANATTIILENTEAIQIVAIISDEKYVLGKVKKQVKHIKLVLMKLI